MNKRIRKKQNQLWADRIHGSKEARKRGRLASFIGDKKSWRDMPPDGPPPLIDNGTPPPIGADPGKCPWCGEAWGELGYCECVILPAAGNK